MKFLAKKVHIQGMAVLLADEVQNKNHNVNGFTMFMQYSLKRAETRNFKKNRSKSPKKDF